MEPSRSATLQPASNLGGEAAGIDELILNACPPMARWLRVPMIGTSARPAGSLGKILHQIRRHAKGGLDDICCSAFFRLWPKADVSFASSLDPDDHRNLRRQWLR